MKFPAFDQSEKRIRKIENSFKPPLISGFTPIHAFLHSQFIKFFLRNTKIFLNFFKNYV